MNDGNSAIADPAQTGSQDSSATASPDVNGGNGPDGEARQLAPEELRTQLAVLTEKYQQSSRDGHKNAEENKELKARMARLEQNGSLTSQQQPQEFPTEEQYVKYWTEEGDKSEKESRAEYKRERYQWEKDRTLENSLSAVHNVMRFEMEQRDKAVSIEPQAAREAVEFFKDVPEMINIPVAEKVERYQAMRAKLIPQVNGRDTSAVKAAAGGSVGGGSARGLSAPDMNMDQEAKKAGFPNWKALKEFQGCSTQAEYQALKKKHNIK